MDPPAPPAAEETIAHLAGTMDARTLARRTLIRLAQKRQRPTSGSAPGFLLARTTRVTYPNIAPILSPLLWAVVGAAATRLYMPERATQDLDVVILTDDAAEARRQLTAAGCLYEGELTVGGSSWRMPDGFPLDMLECAEPWARPALEQAQANRDAQGLPVLPLPYLILMKYQAGRVQDLADVTRMLGQASDGQLAAVRQAFTAWLPDEMEDLESLVMLGRMETNPPESA